MFSIKNYIYDDKNLMLIPREYYKKENLKIFDEYSINKAEYEKIEKILNEKKNQKYTAKDKLLTVAGIAVTYDCQLRCNYCANSSNESNVIKANFSDILVYLKWLVKNVKIKRIIDPTYNKLTIYLSGAGEPTYDWDLFCKIVDEIHRICDAESIECKINLTTNGMLNDHQIRYICDNVHSVMVSFDGIPEIQDTNRKFRGTQATSEKVVNTIKKLDEYGCNYTIRSTLWHSQLDKIENIYNFIYENFENFGAWSINTIVSAGRAKNYSLNNSDGETFVDEFFERYMKLKKDALLKYGKGNFGLLFITNELCGITCGISEANTPFLYPNNNIGICVDASDLSPIVGHIDDGEVKLYSNYSGEIFDVYCKKYAECKGCIAFRFCAGGCPVKFMRKNNIGSVNFECAINKKYYEYLLNEIADGKEAFGWFGKKIYINELDCEAIQITNYEIEKD